MSPHLISREKLIIWFAACAALMLPMTIASAQEKESPWLITPTLSSNPKLGNTIGGVAAYLHKFDDESDFSTFGLGGNISDTDSTVGGLFADVRFDQNRRKLLVAIMGGNIKNEYDDFLGTGVPAKTEDDLHMALVRYAQEFSDDWYVGVQGISTNYAIGADGYASWVLDQVGLTGFDSIGLGLTLEYDDRDNIRNPTQGRRFKGSNVAYREGLGGDVSFDVYQLEYVQLFRLDDRVLLAAQIAGRWTHDAPRSGFSSVTLRGYTRGNYLAPHYSDIDLDFRISLNDHWGLVTFAGVGCLYGGDLSCSDSSNIYASAGAGASYVLKPDAGIVMRAEYAFGEGDNQGFYLSVGQPF